MSRDIPAESWRPAAEAPAPVMAQFESRPLIVRTAEGERRAVFVEGFAPGFFADEQGNEIAGVVAWRYVE